MDKSKKILFALSPFSHKGFLNFQLLTTSLQSCLSCTGSVNDDLGPGRGKKHMLSKISKFDVNVDHPSVDTSAQIRCGYVSAGKVRIRQQRQGKDTILQR